MVHWVITNFFYLTTCIKQCVSNVSRVFQHILLRCLATKIYGNSIFDKFWPILLLWQHFIPEKVQDALRY